ncbi:MAG: hypothetical protein ACYDCK_02990 [Thermoplasmatota archaeon]
MPHAEALREVKRAESEVKSLREAAAREGAESLRGAERRAVDTVERAKVEADAGFQAGLAAAQSEVAVERATRVKRAEADSESVRGKATGAEMGQAVDRVLAAFEKRVTGK